MKNVWKNQIALSRTKTLLLAMTAGSLSLGLSLTAQAQSAAKFSGGSCISQGDWVQGALNQSATIVSALETLRNDPNCEALVKTLDNTPQLKELSQSGNADTQGMAGFYSELKSIGTYLNPKMSDGDNKGFREIVNYMVFRKSFDAINNIHMNKQYSSLDDSQKASIDDTSQKVKNFLARAGTISNVAVSTTKGILAAMPQNELCFNSRPNEAALIFSSIVSSAASLASGGEISNLGEMISSLVQFDRKMHFAQILKGVELENYRASMSCLVESTQEAFCSLQDAQDALDFNRGSNGTDPLTEPLNLSNGTIENSMLGLTVLLRDVPIITTWLQKVLFGIDPQLKVEAEMKNTNWDSVVKFIQTTNTLPATYKDKRKFYLDSSVGQDNQNKAAMIKGIIQELVSVMSADNFGGSANTINFFTTSMNAERMPFFLMGAELPPDFNTRMNPFENIYLTWTREQSHGLNNPDALVETIGERLNMIIEKASLISSSYFSSRMIVDSQNLIVEGMNGPGISPYKALFHVRTYLERLIVKLQTGLQNPQITANQANADAYRSMIPMLSDTILRLNNITNAMSDLAKMNANETNIANNQKATRKAMDIIYEFANMLTSRDSFIGNRVANAVRMDITDTLWRKENISESQEKLLQSMGKDIVTRLSQYFTKDPILQRLDVSQAAAIHIQNLTAVESLFIRNYWDQIVDIDCKLFGGRFCQQQQMGNSPDQGFFSGMTDAFVSLMTARTLRSAFQFFKNPTEDSSAAYNQRARLCIQTLGFQNYYKYFTPLCEGAIIVSEFSNEADSKELNLSYDKTLEAVRKISAQTTPGHISEARAKGVCALRSYIRRNNVYRMYTELQQ